MESHFQPENREATLLLTDDVYLHSGLKHLYKGKSILLINIAEDINETAVAKRTVIIADARIIFSPQWQRYEKVIASFTDSALVWVMTNSLLRFFRCDNFLHGVGLNLSLTKLKNELLRSMTERNIYMKPLQALSPYEKKVLPYFVEGIPLRILSRALCRATKTLNTHRMHITEKYGFRSPVHMSVTLRNLYYSD